MFHPLHVCYACAACQIAGGLVIAFESRTAALAGSCLRGKGPTSTTTLSPEEVAARKACPSVRAWLVEPWDARYFSWTSGVKAQECCVETISWGEAHSAPLERPMVALTKGCLSLKHWKSVGPVRYVGASCSGLFSVPAPKTGQSLASRL